jgi:hypothetical protein
MLRCKIKTVIFEVLYDLEISQGQVPRILSSEMLCGAVRVLEPQETILDGPTIRAQALRPQQAIASAALMMETKCSLTEMVPNCTVSHHKKTLILI